MKQEGLAVVLSGGAARGIAHLGVLQALEESAIRPGVISGVSAGAIVGAFYCHGYSPLEILEIIKENSVLKTLRPSWSTGLIKLDKAEKLFRDYLRNDVFEKLKIPLFISTIQVEEPLQNKYFSQGDIIAPLLGSCSVPPIFRPVEYQGSQLVDGGLINNLPVDPVKDYSKILGVNVNSVYTNIPLDSLAHYVEWVFDVVGNNNIKESIRQCHVVFQPPRMRNFHLTDISKPDALFEVGYEYAMENIGKVLELMEQDKES